MALLLRSLCSLLNKSSTATCQKFYPVLRKSATVSYATQVAAEPKAAELQMPQADGAPKIYDPKIKNIVDAIAHLNLYEVSQLNNLLKETLNIKETPMMAMGAVAAAPAVEEEEEEQQSTKTSFTVKLVRFDDSKKVPLIKEVKSVIEGLNLVQAKKFVETLPQVVRTNIGKAEADELAAKLQAVGGSCEVE